MRNLVVALTGLALAACNPMAQADGADELAEAFHQDLSAGNCDKIFNEAAEEFRQGTPRNDWTALCTEVREYFGEYQEGSRDGIRLNTNNGITTTEITVYATYANARATEVFTYVGTGDDMALLHWTINEDFDASVEETAGPAEKPID